MVTRISAVKPSVLRWARESSNLDLEHASKQSGLKVAQLKQWEAGQQSPTVSQLRKLAETYNRPLGALFLPEPPVKDQPIRLPDFRAAEQADRESKQLRKAILAVNERIAVIDELARDEFDTVHRLDLPTVSRRKDYESESTRLREFTHLAELEEEHLTPEKTLHSLIQILAEHGVFVMQFQKLDMEEVRGFSIRGESAAVIALNSADSPRGKAFTLFHELAHLCMRTSALCDFSRLGTSQDEVFCDRLAAAALLPGIRFRAIHQHNVPITYEYLRSLSDQLGTAASAESVLLRLIDLGLAGWDSYNKLRPEFKRAYLAFKKSQRKSQGDASPPIYYPLKVRDLGKPFISLMLTAHDDGHLSSRDLANVLDMNYHNIGKLTHMAG